MAFPAVSAVRLLSPAGLPVDPRDRNWFLNSGTDSVNVGNFPAPLANYALEAGGNLELARIRLTSILAQLDVALSTRASELTVNSILAKLDVALSTRASEPTLALVKAKTDNLDAALSTRASELTVNSILAKLDVALSTRASTALQYQQRAPEKAGRTYKTDSRSGTADVLSYTVTAGKTLYITGLTVTAYNTATTGGQLAVRDGTTAAGTNKRSFVVAPAATLGSALDSQPIAGIHCNLENNPMPFTTGVFLDIVTGTLTFAVTWDGYEE